MTFNAEMMAAMSLESIKNHIDSALAKIEVKVKERASIGFYSASITFVGHLVPTTPLADRLADELVALGFNVERPSGAVVRDSIYKISW